MVGICNMHYWLRGEWTSLLVRIWIPFSICGWPLHHSGEKRCHGDGCLDICRRPMPTTLMVAHPTRRSVWCQRVRESDTATLWCAACLLVADCDFGIYRGAAETELIACDGDIWCVSSLARRFVLPGTLRASKPKDKHPDTQPFCCNPRKRTLSSPSSS